MPANERSVDDTAFAVEKVKSGTFLRGSETSGLEWILKVIQSRSIFLTS